MTVSNLTIEDAAALAVRTLGMDPDFVGLTSREGLAASLRRAASFMCPTSPGRLIDAVLEVVRPLTTDNLTRDEIAVLVDLLLASGDLLELRQEQQGRHVRLIYLGPPSYIQRAPGNYALLGVRPFGAPFLDTELSAHISSEGHTRTLFLDSAEAPDLLAAAGIRCVDAERWVAGPRQEPASALVERLRKRLDSANRAGEVAGLQILDSASRVRYYRGRWRPPKPGDTADFVCRRPQAYGADLWGLVRLEEGNPTKLLDLPIDDPVVPGRDEAWHAQMAIDAEAGHPQQFATGPATRGDATAVRFFSPIPGFAERYLQLAGMALGALQGALFAFNVPNGAMPGVERLLADRLWLERISKEDQ